MQAVFVDGVDVDDSFAKARDGLIARESEPCD